MSRKSAICNNFFKFKQILIVKNKLTNLATDSELAKQWLTVGLRVSNYFEGNKL